MFRTPASLAGTYGNFTFDAGTGVWTYALVHSQADSLADGQIVYDTLTVTSADGTASHDIIVTVTGTNDAPAITSADTFAGFDTSGLAGSIRPWTKFRDRSASSIRI